MEHNVLSLPSLQSIHGIPLSLLSSIFVSAAEYYQLAPWKLFQEEVPTEIRYPRDKPARIVVVTGMAGDVFGLTVYDSATDHERIYNETDPMKLVHDISWLSLCYDRAEYMAPEDLQVIEEHGWTVIDEKAYPGIVRMGAPGADLHGAVRVGGTAHPPFVDGVRLRVHRR